ncbi:FAD-dependent oxidoreductase [Archangium lipolyticum]|uniref:FAD-dependent oxidoreductase n=1 Tax=Archangium lipolyticum TaxID=2970465 RepID=UPI002149BB33|nr:FAD-dependent oxidoreductase [Archangium lipolyticum]
MKAESTAVLVVGGGLVGLSAAMFLSWRGVPTVLVERHPGSSPHPRAIGYTPRTLELFRAIGLGPRIPQMPADFRLRRSRVESLAGKWFEETPWTPETRQSPRLEYSPCAGAALSQDRLEPILREKAIALGADIRLSTELIRFEQDADGVVASLRARDGREYAMRAAYLIAADGHASPIREALGIGQQGRGSIRTLRSVLFRAPLEEYLRSGISQFNIDQPGLKAFLTTYGDGRWVLMFSDDEERDEGTLRAMVFKAIGRTDLEVELITTGRWELSARIADSFASGRIFLAGDAAHTLPPTRGGYGANTGIEDAHNLAWKLSAVLSGASTPRLLDTYDAERRPIAWLRHGQLFARSDYASDAAGTARDVPIIDDDAMELGQLYRSTAVLDAGDGLPPALRPEQWAGQPGTRAPHLWMTRDGERVSTLDLFQRGWVLLAQDARWCPAAARIGKQLGIDVQCLRIGIDVRPSDESTFRTAFGLGAGGASLIRPDGYVAWRAIELPADPLRSLGEALERVSCATLAC